MKLKAHIAIIGSLLRFCLSSFHQTSVLFFGVLISADSDDEDSNFSSGITGMNLSAEVLKHQPMKCEKSRATPEKTVSPVCQCTACYHSR